MQHRNFCCMTDCKISPKLESSQNHKRSQQSLLSQNACQSDYGTCCTVSSESNNHAAPAPGNSWLDEAAAGVCSSAVCSSQNRAGRWSLGQQMNRLSGCLLEACVGRDIRTQVGKSSVDKFLPLLVVRYTSRLQQELDRDSDSDASQCADPSQIR